MEVELYEEIIGRQDNEIRRGYNYLTDLRNKFKQTQQQIGQTRDAAKLKELRTQLHEYAEQLAVVFRAVFPAIQPSSVSQLEGGGVDPSTICSLLENKGFIRNEQLEHVCKLYGKKMFSSNDKIVKEIMDENYEKGNPHKLIRKGVVWINVNPISGQHKDSTIVLENVNENSLVQDYETQIIDLFKTQTLKEHGQLFDKLKILPAFRQKPLIENLSESTMVVAVMPD
jgi:hypothetical protein